MNIEPNNQALKASSICASIVIYHTPIDQLLACLYSLSEAVSIMRGSDIMADVRVVIVNNGPNELVDLTRLADCRQQLESLHDNLSIIQGQGNVGYGSAQNLAFQAYDSEYHLFLNPDVELDPSALWEGIRYLRSNPDVGMISPFAVDRNNDKQFLCKRYPTVFDFFLRGFSPRSAQNIFRERLSRYEMHDLSDLEPSRNIPIISGCFMFCRSEAIRQASGFDPKYFMYFEDFDLSIRVGKIAALAYVPAMRIRHYGGRSSRKGVRHILMFIASGFRFFSRHGWRWYRQI